FLRDRDPWELEPLPLDLLVSLGVFRLELPQLVACRLPLAPRPNFVPAPPLPRPAAPSLCRPPRLPLVSSAAPTDSTSQRKLLRHQPRLQIARKLIAKAADTPSAIPLGPSTLEVMDRPHPLFDQRGGGGRSLGVGP